MTQPASLTPEQAEAERDRAWDRFLKTPKSDPHRLEKYHAEYRAIARLEATHG